MNLATPDYKNTKNNKESIDPASVNMLASLLSLRVTGANELKQMCVAESTNKFEISRPERLDLVAYT